MTVHNRATFVQAAIRSVLTQSFNDLELILFDDASTDGSLDICRTLAAADPRIRLIESPHVGHVRANQLANELCRGQFVGWVDSDDLLVKTALDDCLAVMQRPTPPGTPKPPGPNALANIATPGMVYTQHVLIDENSRQHGLGERCRIPFSPDRLLVDFMTHHFRLYRRDIYTHIGGLDSTLPAAADYDFCLRLSEVAPIVHIPKPLYCYRIHPLSISGGKRLKQIEGAAAASERALTRRGLAGRYTLHVEIASKFTLLPK